MFRAELLKLRRSMVWFLAPTLPILAVISGGVNYWMNMAALTGGWDSLLSQITLFYGMLFFAIGVALVTAASWRPEHRSSSWNAALTSGHSRIGLVLTKAVIVMIPVAVIQLSLIIWSWLFGTIIGVEGPIPSWFIVDTLVVIVVSAPLVLAQSILSMLLRSFAAPVAICMGGCIVSFLALAGAQNSPILETLTRVLPQALVTKVMFLGSTAMSNAGTMSWETLAPVFLAAFLQCLFLFGVVALVTRRRTVFVH